MKKAVEFKVGKDILRGTLFIPSGKGPFPGVIFFHGSGGIGEMHLESARKLAQNGILGFFFNYRGAGLSEGKFEDQTIAMGIEDSQVAIKFFLSRQEVNKKRIGFCGGSFGGFIASLLCNSLDLKSLVLVAPAAYSSLVIDNTQRDSDKDLEKDFEESHSYKEIAKFKGNLLVASCEFDEVIPPRMVERYLEVAQMQEREEAYLIKGSKHRVSDNPKARVTIQNKLIHWFLQTL